MRTLSLVLILLSTLCYSCGDDPMPKPSGYLALRYEAPEYESVDEDCPYRFEKNTRAQLTRAADCGVRLDYPQMDGAIYLTYRPVDGNLNSLLVDAQKLTYEHVVKADNIAEQQFVDESNQVYGMLYEVSGNAASQLQFYLTDSVNHFLTGSVYFDARPNYDSILPAAHYLNQDVKHLMERFRWK
ncbi:gliding motility lipoprotein GldD [Croceiramulus getboli]|nr:gliding motility lipoprotein GldD [Flavobacteriaceae bacterium YJPT1-3]